MTKSEFILKARQVHGWKYDYSKVNDVIKADEKICIICPNHGEFWQETHSHLSGCNCKKCYKEKNDLNKDKFIQIAQKIYGSKYDYSEVDFKNSKSRITIICPEHGKFQKRVKDFLYDKSACPICSGSRHNKDTFVKKAKEIYGDKYDYSKVNYIRGDKKVCIVCPEHGEFWKRPAAHILGEGCPVCSGFIQNRDTFIDRAKKIYGDKYDYSKVEYNGDKTKVCIVCPEHGEFWKTPDKHIHRQQGCPKCGRIEANKKESLTTEQFIEKAKNVHSDRYDYSKVEYKSMIEPVCIICNKHGEFWQKPHNHVCGKGCPKCHSSKLEMEVIKMLKSNIIEYKHECGSLTIKGLGYQRVDIYLPSLNIVIECQGLQHFKDNVSKCLTHGKSGLDKQLSNDIKKYNILSSIGIDTLYYYPQKYNSKHKISFYDDKKCFHNIEDLKEYILSKSKGDEE